MHWASAISQAARLEDALDEALETVAEDLGGARPDLVVAFVTPDYSSHALRLGAHIIERTGGAAVLGCSAGGVIGGGLELEHERALAITAAVLPGVELGVFHLDDNPQTWRDAIGVAGEHEPVFVVLAEPFTCPTADLVRWLDATYPGSTTIGGLASGETTPGSSILFANTDIVHSGAVGVAMTGDLEVSTIVAQGCRPIGSPVFVTRTDDDLIYELDGQPALNVLESLYKQLPGGDQDLFRHSLFMGLVMDEAKQAYGQGDFLIRNILGIVPQMGALSVAGEVHDNQVVQFHLRDARTSTEDLESLLQRHDSREVAGALLFSCLGRGAGLYGHSNHDSDLFRKRFGQVPIGGFFCNGELGPVGNRTFVHGYTSSFGLFGPKRRA